MRFSRQLGLAILCFGLITAQPMQASSYTVTTVFYTKSGDIDLGRVALYTAGIGLLVYGIYSLYNYLHVSNQQLIEDCDLLLDRAKRYHGSTNILLNRQLSDTSKIPEDVLQLITQEIGTTANIARYNSELAKLQRDLNTKIRKVSKRRAKLVKKIACGNGASPSWAEDQRLTDTILALELAAQPVIQDLELLYRCLNKHANYIELAQFYVIFTQKYYLELAALSNGNMHKLKQLARGAIASEHVLYPLIQYSRILNNDIICLAQALSSLRFNYPILINQAYNLQDKLGYIYRTIVSDSEYVSEQNARREADQRAERLQIERERLELEREKLLLKIINPPAQQNVIIHNHNCY